MKNKLLGILLTAMLAGGVAFSIYYALALRPVLSLAHHPAGEMGWLRQEYHLTDAQYERICRLHCSYAPQCSQMCQRITAQRARTLALIQANREVTPAVKEALDALAVLESEFRNAMLTHLYAVAAEMSPQEGARYLAAMMPAVIASSGRPPASAEMCPKMAHP